MSDRSERAKVSLLSLGAGLAAAGVGAALGVAAERVAVGLPLRPPFGRPGQDEEEYGGLHVPGQVVRASDGTPLHVEVELEPSEPRVTIVVSHGYALSMDSWHFQRKALRGGPFRLVFWDQRGHGRSGVGPPEHNTIDQLGADLESVIEAVAPTGPLILIGHSMGGMTVMSLAGRRPDLFADRVIGVGLVATSAGGLDDVDLGLARLGRMVQRIAPPTVRALTRSPRLVEHGRRMIHDIETVLVKRYSYASEVSPELVRFTAEMIGSTRLDVISDFLPGFGMHDKRGTLAVLDGIETLVIVGDHDLLTPADHSSDIVAQLPGAEHVLVPRSGHMIMLEHPEIVNEHLVALIDRALRSEVPPAAAPPAPDGVRAPSAVRRTVASLRRRRRGDGAA